MRPRLPADPAARLALLVAAWALTRFAVLVVTRARGLYPYQDDVLEISVFSSWGEAFAGDGGPRPLRDRPWEYPAGAAAVVVAPALLRGAPYVLGFVGQMALWDLAVLLVLAVVGQRRGSLSGAWLWVAAVPLLGPVALARFDVVPTALAVGGLAAATAAPALAGVLLAAGAAVKLWPGLLLPLVLLRRGRGRVLAGAAAVAAGTLAAVGAYGGLRHLPSFLTYQRDRGLEVESLPALPLMWARAHGDGRMSVSFAFGSLQVDGPGADALLRAGTVGLGLVVVGVGALAWRCRRADPVLALPALAVLLVAGVLAADKVLSAQYPLWLAGPLCLSLCSPRSPLRPAVAPLAGLLLLTQAVYPLSFATLVDTTDPLPVHLLAARDLLLLVVVAIAGRACWRLSEQRVGADEHRGEHGHRHRAGHQDGVVGTPALAEPGQRPDRREDHQVDPRQ